jgi:predicted nucleic acid-binding protein
MYLLNTNICIAILKNNPKVIEYFRVKYNGILVNMITCQQNLFI